jgi:hypothetical protein
VIVMVETLMGVIICMLLGGMADQTGTSGMTDKEQSMTTQVDRAKEPIVIDGNWDKDAWAPVKPIELTQHMGDRPEHFPKTCVKLLYDDENIYVVIRVKDQFVRAVARRDQDSVCRDSCVEFFFTPGTDTAVGYFNLEMNCGGTMLFHFQIMPRTESVPLDAEDLKRIEVAHRLPKIIDPEITEPTTWTVEYRIPLDLLAKYCPSTKMPAPGITWRANFYKCADDTSQPHWLTWSFVDRPRPDFHVPKSFGTLRFE